MRTQTRWAVAALVSTAALACGPSSPTQGNIAGTITHATTGAVLAGAIVAADPSGLSATTDEAGRYDIALLPAGDYKVKVTLDGYLSKERASVQVTAGGAVTLDFTLTPATGSARVTVKNTCAASAALAGATVARTGVASLTAGSDGLATVNELAPGAYTFSVSATGFLPLEVTGTVAAGSTLELQAELVCQSKAAADVARQFLAATPPPSVVTSAKSVRERLTDTDAANDPLVISVRSAADYAAGHVPGAINLPWKTVADEASLAKLGAPGARTGGYVDYCYTGHTGGIAAGVLNLLGYKTANMKYGIASWTLDAAARTAGGIPPDQTKDFGLIETTVNTPTQTFSPPTLAFPEAKTPGDVVKLAARAYLQAPGMGPTIGAQALFDNLNDGNPANDPFIISVRKPEHYALGHLKGAINIPWTEIAKEENLKKIPTDRDIVIYCYTGHTGAVATSVLGVLGYHRVKNLKFGMNGWTQSTTVRASTAFVDEPESNNDFPVTTGVNP
ncbi:MAG: rhodanese-like domain-containing protein [Myxococcaceae bacterium]